MATDTAIQNGLSRLDRLSAEDFETASIRSAAPSYISDAPSYHSMLLTNESVPEYTPPEPRGSSMASPPRYAASTSMLNVSSTPTPMTSTFAPGAGLPRIPSPRRRNDMPHLHHFSIPTWSSMNSNPTARHYQRVAHRRVSAATGRHGWSGVENALRTAMDRINAAAAAEAEDPDKIRPLEDPYLVGEEAAARARQERLARQNGEDVLIREERRWDWFLGQSKDWDERDRSWGAFSTNIENRGRLARRFGR
ncbi:v-type proton ATPase 16 kDa proteolipid subunit 2 [Hypoxylon texense]